ncbi:MAG: HAMP domain-containing protein [Alphaproteobacteria bacterium]|nr:HAMP domain-containing protein [Alphaproteobacteria bacterium]
MLAASLAVGSAMALRNASRLVAAELDATLEVAAQTVRDGIDDFANEPDHAQAARRLVAGFDGDRHATATLLDRAGNTLARSSLHPPTEVVPGWFRSLLAPSPARVRFDLPDGGAIVLAADPLNELAERWSELGDSLRQLGLFFVLAAAAVLWITQRALRPLHQLARALERIEAGDYAAHVEVRGPPEIGRLAATFNRMATQLATTEALNARLHLQLLNLQEEERADLARDLHDDIGPFLFAVNVHAAGIGKLAETGRTEEIAAQVRAIHDAVGHMQGHVKAILGRLRPARPEAFGLGEAIDGLVAFWRHRHPDIAFVANSTLEEEALDETAKETIYRLVQESLTNAVRHGRPQRIEVALARDPSGAARLRVADDGRGAAVPAQGVGFGLAGMRERVAALGGQLAVESGPQGGWTVTASLPTAASPLVAP